MRTAWDLPEGLEKEQLASNAPLAGLPSRTPAPSPLGGRQDKPGAVRRQVLSREPLAALIIATAIAAADPALPVALPAQAATAGRWPRCRGPAVCSAAAPAPARTRPRRPPPSSPTPAASRR